MISSEMRAINENINITKDMRKMIRKRIKPNCNSNHLYDLSVFYHRRRCRMRRTLYLQKINGFLSDFFLFFFFHIIEGSNTMATNTQKLFPLKTIYLLYCPFYVQNLLNFTASCVSFGTGATVAHTGHEP